MVAMASLSRKSVVAQKCLHVWAAWIWPAFWVDVLFQEREDGWLCESPLRSLSNRGLDAGSLDRGGDAAAASILNADLPGAEQAGDARTDDVDRSQTVARAAREEEPPTEATGLDGFRTRRGTAAFAGGLDAAGVEKKNTGRFLRRTAEGPAS
jgi:hypothetical protein